MGTCGRKDDEESVEELGVPGEDAAAFRRGCLREEEGLDRPVAGLAVGSGEGASGGAGRVNVAHFVSGGYWVRSCGDGMYFSTTDAIPEPTEVEMEMEEAVELEERQEAA